MGSLGSRCGALPCSQWECVWPAGRWVDWCRQLQAFLQKKNAPMTQQSQGSCFSCKQHLRLFLLWGPSKLLFLRELCFTAGKSSWHELDEPEVISDEWSPLWFKRAFRGPTTCWARQSWVLIWGDKSLWQFSSKETAKEAAYPHWGSLWSGRCMSWWGGLCGRNRWWHGGPRYGRGSTAAGPALCQDTLEEKWQH